MLFFWILSDLLSTVCQASGELDTKCYNNCKCCKDEKCVSKNGWANVCVIGCIDGHRGARCYELCKYKNCKYCGFNNKNKTCTDCYDGYYLGPNKDCTSSCPSNCKSCTSSTHCTKCKEDFYNDNGSTTCPYQYCPANCECKPGHGDCVSCKQGFYDTTMACNKQCPVNCITCESDVSCNECKRGFYNGFEYDNNKNLRLNTCTYQCRDKCTKCQSYNKCSLCTEGRFGITCQKECSVGCKDKTCRIGSGECECTTNFSGVKCMECVDNKYGLFCNQTCPKYCKRNVCETKSGKCMYGCISGYYGQNCDKPCSQHCANNTCNRDTGKCINGCTSGYSGDRCCVMSKNCVECYSNKECKTCVPGYFRSSCNETCLGGCPASCNISTGECIRTGQTGEPSSLTGPVAGGVVALVVVIAGIFVSILFIRRRRMQKGSSNERIVNGDLSSNGNGDCVENVREGPVYANIQDTPAPEAELEDVVLDESNDKAADDKTGYYNSTSDDKNVEVEDLLPYVTKDHCVCFENEFKNLPKPDNLSTLCKIAKKEMNIKNRYNGIYPFDHSRVTIPGEPKFYMNACYINGYKKRKAYIASFGPTSRHTKKFKAFWQMVWHEKSDMVVMLTNLVEATGMKCEQYWPAEETEECYGHIKVTCRNIEEFAEYTVRSFTVSKGKEQRNLTQVHLTVWPDKGVPSEVTSLVEFRQRVKTAPVALGGPIIVHCSAGVGRTGTFIALDILSEQGKAERLVNVFDCVQKLREQRVNMVQTAAQYIFLHKALVHTLTFGCEAKTAEEIQCLSFDDDDMFMNMYQTLYQEVDDDREEDIVAREENKRKHVDKSRRHSDIPGNRGRVHLFLQRKTGDHDFINAVFINSFKFKNLFIAAQTPMSDTVEDFLCMIYQENSCCIVDLEDPLQHSKEYDVGIYLPADNKEYTCGEFIVTSTEYETKPQYTIKKITIKHTGKGKEKMAYHFQYTTWGNGQKVPESPGNFVQVIKDVGKYVNKKIADIPNVVVHCLNGYERSGLFCVVYTLLEKVEAERQVSVVNVIRKVRAQRKLSIPSVDQLKFCYQCLSAYIDKFNTYSNFGT